MDLCRIIFSPSHFVRRKLVGPSVFCLKMPPGYPFVLQFVSIRRPQRPQRNKRIYDKRQNNCRLVLKSFMYNCNLTKIHVTVIAIEYLEHKQINSIVLALPCLQLQQTRTKLYTLFMTEREETISCPAAHPRTGHIRETGSYRSGGLFSAGDPCRSSPCNGGKCIATERGDGYKCACPEGFYGENCEKGKYRKLPVISHSPPPVISPCTCQQQQKIDPILSHPDISPPLTSIY